MPMSFDSSAISGVLRTIVAGVRRKYWSSIIISIIGMSWPHEGMGLKSRSNDSCMATPS